METLRNLWLNWAGTYPVWSSLAVGAIAIACWWIFGGVLWLSKPRADVPAIPVMTSVNEREWPPLTDAQVTEWVNTLRPFQIKSLSVFWSHEVEAAQLYRSLKSIGKQLGAEVLTGLGGTDGPEIEVIAADGDATGPAIVELFHKLKYPVKLEHENRKPGQVAILIPEKPH
jgi:hypothetical protein